MRGSSPRRFLCIRRRSIRKALVDVAREIAASDSIRGDGDDGERGDARLALQVGFSQGMRSRHQLQQAGVDVFQHLAERSDVACGQP